MERNWDYLLCLLFSALIFNTLNINGQDEINYGYLTRTAMSNPVISPPPTVSSLGKYIEVPVSIYTGVPSINIPLYEIEADHGYSLPISLSYHASGVKVQQRAGNVGLGWSLNAGGVITRVIRGIPDDQDSVATDTDYKYYLHRAGKLFHPETDSTFYTPDSIWNFDVESDQYYFNFNGYSGKFYFNGKNEIVYSGKEQPLDITYQGEVSNEDSTGIGIPQFTIITQDGIRYIFNWREIITDIPTKTDYNWYDTIPLYSDVHEGWTVLNESQNETNLVDEREAAHFRHISSWYLGKIEFPGSKDSIVFDYDIYKYNYVEKTGEVNRYGYEYEPDYYINLDYYTYKASLIDAPVLKEIRFRNGYISFNSNTDNRLDIYDSNTAGKLWYNDLSETSEGNYYENYFNSEPYIDNIVVYNSNDTEIKEIQLRHHYFKDSRVVNADADWKHLYYRLRLDSIIEASNPSKPPYVFSYDTTSQPYRYDPQVDIWGYYNANGSLTQIPKLYVDSTFNNKNSIFRSIYCPIEPNGFTISATSDTITGADRRANPDVNQCFILKKIKYPTGGYDCFDYESNEFVLDNKLYQGGGLRIKRITILADLGDTASVKEYSYVDENDISSGRIMNIPLFAKFYTYSGSIRADGYKYWSRIVNLYRYSNSLSDLGSTAGSIVGYKNVQIRYSDAGMEKYTFSMPGTMGVPLVIDEESGDTIYRRHVNKLYRPPPIVVFEDTVLLDHAPFIPDPDIDWARGLLLNKEVLDEDDNLLFRIDNTYKTMFGGFDTLWYKGRGVINLLQSSQYIMTYTKYLASKGWKYLKESKEYTIDQSTGQDTIITTQYFVKNGKQLLTERGLIDSKGDTIKTRFKYTSDESGQPYLSMVNNLNLINYPTKVERYNETTFLESLETKYEEWYPDQFAPQYKISKTGNNAADTISEYHSYDSALNPITFSKSDNYSTTYLWGYDNVYPVAQINNAEVDEVFYTSFEVGGSTSSSAYTGEKVKTLSTNYIVDKSFFPTGPYRMTYLWRENADEEWEYIVESKVYTHTDLQTNKSSGQIDELRVYPADAQMITYTYTPLVGMTSETDPNGITTRYIYDSSGRLIRIKDSYGNLLKEIEYNFANQ